MVSILQGYNKPSILFSPTNGVELRTIAETAGLLHCGTTPLMELRCERFIPEETVGRVKVQEVANMQELGEAIKIQASALDFDEAVITRTMGEKVLEVPNVKVFVGRDEAEQPICTMTVVESEGIATIWNVGTLPEHQRQGYGRELMQEVLELYSGGKRPGIKAFYLMSSEAGLKLYNNLGFETVREYDTWLVGEEPVSE